MPKNPYETGRQCTVAKVRNWIDTHPERLSRVASGRRPEAVRSERTPISPCHAELSEAHRRSPAGLFGEPQNPEH
jgi:hypothetical protein